jgi:hypothetical protein
MPDTYIVVNQSTQALVATGGSTVSIVAGNPILEGGVGGEVTQAELDAVAASVPSTETIQDTVGGMVTGNTETGIAVTYDDPTGKLNFVAEVTQAELDAVAAAAPNTEAIQDIVGGMVTGNTEVDIVVTYDDVNGKLDFTVTGGGGSSQTVAQMSDSDPGNMRQQRTAALGVGVGAHRVTATLANSTAVTGTGFDTGWLNASVTGPGIQAGTRITAVTSTTMTLSVAATSSGSQVLTIAGFLVRAGTGMAVDWGGGWIRPTPDSTVVTYSASTATLTADATNPRWYLIANSAVFATVEAIAGTPAAVPVWPDLRSVRAHTPDSSINAAVYVPAAAASSAAFTIFDKRYLIDLGRMFEVIAHGGTAGVANNTARPPVGTVHWKGAGTPTNAVPGDTWSDLTPVA